MRTSHGVSRAVCAGLGLILMNGLAVVAAAAQDATPEDQTDAAQASAQPAPPLSITTHEVLLDVVVTAGGHPLKGLKASDFIVLEEGKPQKVASLEEHGPMSAEVKTKLLANPPLPPNTFTNYTPVSESNAYTVILLDALNSRLDDQMLLRQELIRCLKQLPPGVPVAIFERDTKMHLVQGFTTDPQVLSTAAESARSEPRIPGTMRATHEESLEYRLNSVLVGFGMLGRYLAAFPGRKNLIWFTGPLLGSEVLDPMGDPFNDEFRILEGDPHDLTAALTLSRVAVYPIDTRGLQTATQYQASTNRMPAVNANLEFERKQAFGHLGLDAVADSTGGLAFHNSNRIGEKIAAIEANGSDYYTLTYATTNKDWNGAFRRIKIDLDQPNVKLQYREGYYAVDRSKQEQRQLEKMKQGESTENGLAAVPQVSAIEAKNESQAAANGAPRQIEKGATAPPPKEGFEEAMLMGAIPPTEVIFIAHASAGSAIEQMKKDDPWPADNYLADPYKYKPFRSYTVDYTVDGTSLHLAHGEDGLWHGSVAFVTVVYDTTGQNVNSKMTTTSMDLDDDQYREVMEHGLASQQQIAVPVKGSYFLRLGVHCLGNDRIGALEIAADQVKPDNAGAAANMR